MLDPDFISTGFASTIQDTSKFTRFQVVGERSSGTNYVKRLLGRNTALRPTEDLGWKHGFAHALAIPADLVVIGVVRRADDWARSMHSKPWHCTPKLQSLAFSQFIEAEWDTIIDRPRYFAGAKEAGLLGQPLMHDRHPLTGEKFANLFELRASKLTGLLSYFSRDCSFILLRLEDVIADPEAMLGKILGCLEGATQRSDFRPVIKRLGSKFKPSVEQRFATPDGMSNADMRVLLKSVNTDQEDALGYAYSRM
ncbi:MAG: hypothetical protein ABJL99_21660 [Aliishimia sp.]